NPSDRHNEVAGYAERGIYTHVLQKSSQKIQSPLDDFKNLFLILRHIYYTSIEPKSVQYIPFWVYISTF
ncbi:MAG TPA: hypothetical protein PKG96_09970, partial [Bacilli bacterium]|nr:hypothetical protein [Bacilli bacterium]